MGHLSHCPRCGVELLTSAISCLVCGWNLGSFIVYHGPTPLPCPQCETLRAENAALRLENERLKAENDRLGERLNSILVAELEDDAVTERIRLRIELHALTERNRKLEAVRVENRTALKWTTEPPTVPGWYWVKFETPRGITAKTITCVYQHDIDNAPDDIDGHMFAGPIPEPKPGTDAE